MLWIYGIQQVVAGSLLLIYPHAVSSTAYDWARTLLPGRAWGALFLTSGLLCLLNLYRARPWQIRCLLVWTAVSYFTFGLSIAGLTLTGSSAALIGSVMWWGYVAISLVLLSYPLSRDQLMSLPRPYRTDSGGGDV